MSLTRFFRRRHWDEERARELEAYLQAETDENIARGMSPEEARYAAHRKLGNTTLIREEIYRMNSLGWLEALWQDVRYGLRQFRRDPRFTVVAVITIALGIGANTAMFSVVNAVLLKPLAYPQADHLVWLADFSPGWGDNYVMPAAYLMWRDAARSFQSMVAYANQDVAMIAKGESAEERVATVSDGFWEMTAAQPAMGRLFGPSERDCIVLSHALFARRFRSDPQLIGKTLSLAGHSFTITGVLPSSYQFLFPQQSYAGDERREIDAYIPITGAALQFWTVTEKQLQDANASVGPSAHAVCVVGKLRPDVAAEQARAEMEAIFARVKQGHYPSWVRNDLSLHFAPLKEKLIGKVRYALLLLSGAVGFVLLIACANAANLLLARASTRWREVAIRAAMGAGPGRLARQFLTESVLLALLGGGLGILLAWGAQVVMIRLGSSLLPRVGEATLDIRVLIFAVVISLGTGLLFGLAPLLSLRGAHLIDVLKDDAKTFLSARLRAREMVVAGELALAVVLLSAAGLMIRSSLRMTMYPPGFEPEKVLVMRVALSGPAYNVWLREDEYLHELIRGIKAIPGVQEAGVDRSTLNVKFTVDGSPAEAAGQESVAALRAVSPSYLRALGVPLVRGSWPRDDESFDSLIVNEKFARKVFGKSNPLGQRVSAKFLNGTIVGVVADFKYWRLDAEPGPEVYFPYQLSPGGRSIRLIVRTSGDPSLAAPVIRKLATQIDPTQPVYELNTLERALADSIAPRRFNLVLLEAFAMVAVLMAVVGIYGVTAFWVNRRTREIGVRMALGAGQRDVLAMVVGEGLKMALVGGGIGILGALALARFLSNLLYDLRPTDPLTFAAVLVISVVVAIVASYVPARRAAKVDPMVALRYE